MNGCSMIRTCERAGRILGLAVVFGRVVVRCMRRNIRLRSPGSARHRDRFGHRRLNGRRVCWRGGVLASAAVAASVVVAAAIPTAAVGQESGAAPPNIVFIITDDMSWAHMGAYGSDEVDTPNLDRLAREGAIFENAFVSAPSCTPSRASILTGRNGFELEEGATLWGYLPAKFPTYTELLAEHGYRVGATGKGWAPGFLIDRDVNPAGQPYNRIRVKPFGDRFESLAMSDIDYTANFEAFLDSTEADRPFSFWMGTYEPHRGYTPGVAAARGKDTAVATVPAFLPDVPAVRADINEYYAEIEHVDDHVGRVMEVLNRRGLRDNTIVVFTSDNGMPFPRAKATLYDYGTRMPLIVWWGDNIDGGQFGGQLDGRPGGQLGGQRRGQRIGELVSHTDIAPTFLEIAGVEAPAEMTGRSLVPLLTTGEPAQDFRDAVYMYRERHGFYPGTGGRSFPSRAIRTQDYLLIWNARTDAHIRDVDGGPTKSYMEENAEALASLYDLSFGTRDEYELYDVRADAYQMRNLAGDEAYADVFGGLRSQLFGYLESRADPRMLGHAASFLYAPYFGVVFRPELLQWTPEQQGQEFTFEERRDLLRKAYSAIGEIEFYQRMIAGQAGRL